MNTHPRLTPRPWNFTVRPKLVAAWLSAIVPVLVVACGEAPPQEPPAEDTTATATATLDAAPMPLKVIMAVLGTDMADIATGIWVEDAATIAEGAAGIANHPRVPPEQMGAIQAELGQAFGDFAALDGVVHDLAVELRDAASAGQATSELVTIFTQVAEGCVGCHTAFRERLSSTLANGGQGG